MVPTRGHCIYWKYSQITVAIHLTLLDVGFLKYCPLCGGGSAGPWYLSSGSLKIPELTFPKKITYALI